MTAFQVYWWLKLTDIQTTLSVIGIMSIFGCGIWTLFNCAEDLEHSKKQICLFIVGTVIGLVALFMPNSKQYATIKILPMVTNSEIGKVIPEDMKILYDASVKYLKTQLKEQENL